MRSFLVRDRYIYDIEIDIHFLVYVLFLQDILFMRCLTQIRMQ